MVVPSHAMMEMSVMVMVRVSLWLTLFSELCSGAATDQDPDPDKVPYHDEVTPFLPSEMKSPLGQEKSLPHCSSLPSLQSALPSQRKKRDTQRPSETHFAKQMRK